MTGKKPKFNLRSLCLQLLCFHPRKVWYMFLTLHAFESYDGQSPGYQSQKDFIYIFEHRLEGEGKNNLSFDLVKSTTFPYIFAWHKEGWDNLLRFSCCISVKQMLSGVPFLSVSHPLGKEEVAQARALSFRGAWGVRRSARMDTGFLFHCRIMCTHVQGPQMHVFTSLRQKSCCPPARLGAELLMGLVLSPPRAKGARLAETFSLFCSKFIDFRPSEPEAAIKSSLPANSEMAGMSSWVGMEICLWFKIQR